MATGNFLVFEIPYNCFSDYKTNFDFIFEISVNHFKNIFSRFEITGRSEGFRFSIEDNKILLTQQKTSYRKIAYSIPLIFSDEDHSKVYEKIVDYPVDHPIDINLKVLAEIISGNPKFNGSLYDTLKLFSDEELLTLAEHIEQDIDISSLYDNLHTAVLELAKETMERLQLYSES